MTIARHYSEPFPPSKALQIVRDLAGTQFAPRAADAMETLWRDGAVRRESG
jgi:HD-GYP domain-containing protein (c-di-GMP phosphodiesterase class II)